MTVSNINSLSKEMMLTIFDKLHPANIFDLMQASRVCKLWSQFINSNELWQSIVKRIGLTVFTGTDRVKEEALRCLNRLSKQISSPRKAYLFVSKPNMVSGYPSTLKNIFNACYFFYDDSNTNKLSLVAVIQCCKGERNVVKAAITQGAVMDAGSLDAAIDSKDIEIINLLPQEIKAEEMKDEQRGFISFIKAVKTGDFEIVNEIRKYIQIDPLRLTSDAKKALYNAAVFSGNDEMLQFAKKLGGKINKFSLNVAIKKGHSELAYDLIKQGKKINNKSFNYALKSKDLTTIFLVIQQGGEPDEESYLYAILSEKKEVVDLFAKKYPRYVLFNKTLIQQVIAKGTVQALELALELHFQDGHDNDDAISYILKAIQRVNRGADMTLLEKTLEKFYKPKFKGPQTVDQDASSAAFRCSMSGWSQKYLNDAIAKNVDIVKVLLKHGFEADAVNFQNVILTGDLELIRSNKAARTKELALKVKDLDAAIQTQDPKIVTFLLDEIGPIINEEHSIHFFDVALRTTNLEIIKLIFDAGGKPQDETFHRALCLAYILDDRKILDFVIKAGAKPNEKSIKLAHNMQNEDFLALVKQHS
jgi:hypothetical protein